MRPLHDRVLVTRLDAGEQKMGGIIIPDSAKEKPQQAEVKAVGSGKLLDSGERVAPEVKPGDRILFGKYSGSEIKIEGDNGGSGAEHRRSVRGFTTCMSSANDDDIKLFIKPRHSDQPIMTGNSSLLPNAKGRKDLVDNIGDERFAGNDSQTFQCAMKIDQCDLFS